MNILFLCNEYNLCWDTGHYARAFRRRGIEVTCAPLETPMDVDVRILVGQCAERPAYIFRTGVALRSFDR